ncbi:MAG: hypothetical protein L0Y35_09755 [Flammeovirgaceae bacterium]|nr:hypothetical protein [Flammeovirgaceae bacterium]
MMDLKKEILKEHSKRQTEKIVRYVGNDPKHFKELVNLFLEGPYRVTQRAGWPLSYCVQNYPTLINPHLSKVIAFARKTGVHDAVKRNVVRLLQFIEMPKRSSGLIADLCFEFFSDRKQPIAVRVFSMTVLSRVARYEPDLKRELKIIIEDELPYGSAGFATRAKRVLKEL